MLDIKSDCWCVAPVGVAMQALERCRSRANKLRVCAIISVPLNLGNPGEITTNVLATYRYCQPCGSELF